MDRIGIALENAAQFLPEDFMVEATVERHGYSVVLIHKDGTRADIDGDDLASCVEDAVQIALDIVDPPTEH